MGIEGHRPNHSLRSTSATQLFTEGADEQLIIEWTRPRSVDGVHSYKRTSLPRCVRHFKRNQKLTTTQLHLPSSSRMLPLYLPAHSLHTWLWTTITLPTHQHTHLLQLFGTSFSCSMPRHLSGSAQYLCLALPSQLHILRPVSLYVDPLLPFRLWSALKIISAVAHALEWHLQQRRRV